MLCVFALTLSAGINPLLFLSYENSLLFWMLDTRRFAGRVFAVGMRDVFGGGSFAGAAGICGGEGAGGCAAAGGAGGVL